MAHLRSVNRRRFLGAAGAILSAAVVGDRSLSARDPLRVRLFLTDRASDYDGLAARVQGYLGAALDEAHSETRITVVDRDVSLPSEEGQSSLSRRWPLMVVRSAARRRDVKLTDGVNLLVTDGDPRNQPAGFARRHVAAATGARLIARMPPVAETDAVVPYTIRAAATQLVIHEVGHALGLAHAHGRATVTDGGVAASPMVGSYIWQGAKARRRYLGAASACGDPFTVPDAGAPRQLDLRYSACAIAELIDG